MPQPDTPAARSPRGTPEGGDAREPSPSARDGDRGGPGKEEAPTRGGSGAGAPEGAPEAAREDAVPESAGTPPAPGSAAGFTAPGRFDAQAFLRTLTTRPGVYRMLDEHGEVLYVGKARNLRRRVGSYFRTPALLPPKTRALLERTCSMEVTVTHTETEALLLESNLIKEHRPRYNVLLRDDKSYPWIHVTTDEEFPRLAFHRGRRGRRGRYFGPYASAGAVRETLNLLQKLFMVRQCSNSFFRNRVRPCLQHQIRRCTAPCVGLVDEEHYREDVRHAIMFLEGKSDEMIDELVGRMERAAASLDYELAARYRDQILSLRRVQERQYVGGARGDVDVLAAWTEQGVGVVELSPVRSGQSLGTRSYFPRNTAGAEPAELLSAFIGQYYLGSGGAHEVPPRIVLSHPLEDEELLARALSEASGRRVGITVGRRGNPARWVERVLENARDALARRLGERETARLRLDALARALELDEVPERIECFDVSHTGGEGTVASCVVFGAEGALKSDYRRFNITGVDPGDDYAALEQALARRYQRVQREEGRLPDLVLIDGGKGQLARALEVFESLGLDTVELAAVSKGPSRKPGLEAVHRPGRERPLSLAPTSAGLHLIQHIRDEAHRFAIAGHRARRRRVRRSSPLEGIPGIGPTLRQRLLTEFGGLQGLRRAGVEDLARVRGVSRTLARKVYEALREGA